MPWGLPLHNSHSNTISRYRLAEPSERNEEIRGDKCHVNSRFNKCSFGTRNGPRWRYPVEARIPDTSPRSVKLQRGNVRLAGPQEASLSQPPPPLRPSHGSFYRARELRRRNGLEASFSEAQLVAPVGFALDQPRR